MQSTAKTPQEFLAQLEDDWRKEKLLTLRTLIKQLAPDLAEGINYKMLAYGDHRGHVFHLNAQKSCVSLYVGNAAKIDPTGELLKGIDIGKGCIRFKKTLSITDTRIEEFIRRTIDMWHRGEDLGPYT